MPLIVIKINFILIDVEFQPGHSIIRFYLSVFFNETTKVLIKYTIFFVV